MDNNREYSKQTDEVISRQFSKYAELRKREGFVTARKAAVDEILAGVMWLDTVAGTQATYNLIQNLADNLVASCLRVDA